MKLNSREFELVTRALKVLSAELADHSLSQAEEAYNLRIKLQTEHE